MHGSTSHTLAVSAPKAYPIPDDWDATVELLTRPGEARHVTSGEPLADVLHDRSTSPTSLPSWSVRLTTSSGLRSGPSWSPSSSGTSPDRLDHVLARQIDTPEKFLRFVYLMLSLGDPYLLADSPTGPEPARGCWRGLGEGPGVLELVLRALADRPSALDDLDRLVQRLQATERGRRSCPKALSSCGTSSERRTSSQMGRMP